MAQIEGALGPYANAGTPVDGTNEVQTITPSAVPASGTFKLKFEGFETTALAYNVSANAMQTALNLLPTIGTSGVAVALDGGTGVYTITFSGANVAKRAQELITVVSNTVLDAAEDAVTLTVAEGTPGVTATCLGALKGALLIDVTNGVLYINTGTAAAPVWQNFIPTDVLSATELEFLDGVEAGTVTASKAVVVGANKNVDVLAIADLKLGSGAGTSVVPTAEQINLLTQGVAAGYKIARGVATITADSQDIVTGLATVVSGIVTMTGDPSMTHMFSSATPGNQTDAPVAGSLRIKSWKPTAVDDATPIPATTPFGNVSWIAIGT